MLLAKADTEYPFDINSLSSHRWETTSSNEERRRKFLTHWNAIQRRPPLVPAEPLIS
jgi:hypothetical protein